MLKKMILAFGLVALLAPASRAGLVYDTAVTGADLISSRESANFVLGGEYENLDVTVSWEITNLGGGSWKYEYSFAGFDVRQAGISHIILDLSDDAVLPTVDAEVVTNFMTDGTLGSTEYGDFGVSGSNPGFPANFNIIGVKFNINGGEPLTFEFISNRAPVWGDFYLKGGSSSYAYNDGLTLHDSSMSVNDFIARPNGQLTAVPEPASLISAGLGLGITGLARLRRRRQARTA